MLKRIKIENLALVENTELELGKGLSVLTGETGAGKSIIVTALSLALGGRAEREYIRTRADRCSIEATFDVTRTPTEYKKEHSDLIDQGELRIAREIARDGSSKLKINGKPATISRLKTATSPIAEILGQHANQMLMDENNHLDFLDHFAALDELKQLVSDSFYSWKETSAELASVTAKRDQMTGERELLLFQKNEIEKAQIVVGEEEQLLSERKILDSARALMASAEKVRDIIENEESSVSSLLSEAQKELDRMARVDTQLEKKVAELSEITYQVEDLRSYIERYGSSIMDDPGRIEEINLRLDELYNLKKKYGGSEQAILESLEMINQRLADTPPDINAFIDELTDKCRKLFEEYSHHALGLTDTRKKAAGYLQKLVVKELQELAIDNGGFEFQFIYEDDENGVLLDRRAVKPSANGLEQGRIMFSANPGEPLKSLVKTASGGEISRVLLALKSAEKKSHKLSHSLLVFDEVDSGIGGRTAARVGQKLKRLAAENQLLVITHLHQIARESDHHYVAEKTTGKNRRAVITVRKLDGSEKGRELSRMVALPDQP
ncbi:MAG: DNA repair protein RecN [Candidatus Zixiibacteriota bacterium]|nr:MAG: DNA repair protein RecN [candidate division Zixibacteria bacterium]